MLTIGPASPPQRGAALALWSQGIAAHMPGGPLSCLLCLRTAPLAEHNRCPQHKAAVRALTATQSLHESGPPEKLSRLARGLEGRCPGARGRQREGAGGQVRERLGQRLLDGPPAAAAPL